MAFLIGVCILIVFIIICVVIVKWKLKRVLRNVGLEGINIGEVVRQARIEEKDTPKSLASMDSIYLKRLYKDFPEVNIDKLKKEVEGVIHEVFQAFDKGDTSSLTEDKKVFVDNMFRDYGHVHYRHFKIHNTVLSNYKKNNYMATITFASSFEYELEGKEGLRKVQDRVKIEYVYIIDEKKLPKKISVLGIRCPNCGAPITLLDNNRVCNYCGGEVIGLISRVFTFNCIVRY